MESVDLFEKYPTALEPYCDIHMNDSLILVYTGVFSLISDEMTIDICGTIGYSLCSGLKLLFDGKVSRRESAIMIDMENCRISTPNGLSGDCFVNSCLSGEDGTTTVRGAIQTLFSPQKECVCWHWSYLNMTRFIGDCIRRVKGEKKIVSSDRLVFCCKDGTQIIMENTEGQTKPGCKTPYIISHFCKLIPAGGSSIDFDSAHKYISAFTHFISFVVGRYHSALFIAGEGEDGTRFSYYYSGYDYSQISVNSWLPFPKDKDIEKLWIRFEEIWNGNDMDKADILSTAIHWYLEANMGSGKLEGAFIMAITAIEMFWNVILSKKENKASLSLQELMKKMSYSPNFDVKNIIDTRNYIIHYEKKNRIKYQKMTRNEKLQSLENALNVLELVILYWLDYKGHYADRTSENKWRGASTKVVPWVTDENTPSSKSPV